MCGRYTLFTDEEYQDIRKIIRAVQEKGHEVKTGEIYPTNPAPILVWEGKETVPQAVKWGWPKFQRKRRFDQRPCGNSGGKEPLSQISVYPPVRGANHRLL